MGEKSSRARPPKRKKPSGKPRAEPVPQPHGGALVPGAGGGPQPGSGRPPNEFKNFLASLRKDPQAQEALKKAALDPELRSFGPAWKVITDYDDEKPAKKLEVSEPLSTAERNTRIQRIIDRVMGKVS